MSKYLDYWAQEKLKNDGGVQGFIREITALGGVVQWKDTCQVSRRPWVQSPGLG